MIRPIALEVGGDGIRIDKRQPRRHPDANDRRLARGDLCGCSEAYGA